MASWLRLFVACAVLLVGCSSDTTSPAGTETVPSTTAAVSAQTNATTTSIQSQPVTTEQEAPSATTTTAAATTTEPVFTVTEAAVNGALVDYLPIALAETSYGGKAFCGHYLHGFEQDGNNVAAYISGWCAEYYVEQQLMEMGTGHGVHARVDLTIGGDGLSAYSHEQPLDGEDQPEVFPQWVLDAMPTQRKPIIPDQPLTQAAAYYGAVPERALSSGATCEDVSGGYSLYEFGVMYWLREGRPDALDVDNDGRPCEREFAPHLVEMYWEPMRFPLESGLLCRDLDSLGLSLGDAVMYWLREERPGRMDADGNGIPCETVFDQQAFDGFYAPVSDEPSGQLCRDLAESGHRFGNAVAYWLMEGSPDRMDTDGNGIPCETVYDAMEIASHLWAVDKELDGGLFCHDLADMSFTAVVRYWMHNGMPARMDADGNGIPCETVYDQFEIDDWVEFDRIWRVD